MGSTAVLKCAFVASILDGAKIDALFFDVGTRNLDCEAKATMIANRDVILNEGETYIVEFKKSTDKTISDEVCAFANASGGKIYVGITDDNVLVGTDISNRARAILRDTIDKIEPKTDFFIDVDLEDKVFIVTVPEGKDKPYSAPSGYYLRVGAGKIKLTRNQLLAFIQREGNIRYDEIVRSDLPLSKKFNDSAYDKYLEAAGISKVLGREAILENLSCAAEDGGRYVFTNAGALFFRHNDGDIVFEHGAIVCALYKGMTKVHILDVQRYDSDLVSNIDNAVLFLKRNLRTRYEFKTIMRKEILELPEIALKETVVNAVCHRNYFEKGANIMVEIFDDRVEITSPGGAPSGIGIQNFGRISIRRNPIIASLLHRIDYVEKMGTGIGRIREAMAVAGAEDPIFENDAFFRVVFRRPAIGINENVRGYNLLKEDTHGRIHGQVHAYVDEQVFGYGSEQVDEQVFGYGSGQVREKSHEFERGQVIGYRSEQVDEQVNGQVDEQVVTMLKGLLLGDRSKRELLALLGLTKSYGNYARHIVPLIDKGYIKMTKPDKPTSSVQKYRLTPKGKSMIS
jgi:ATP-dependent DNA helicase RecG